MSFIKATVVTRAIVSRLTSGHILKQFANYSNLNSETEKTRLYCRTPETKMRTVEARKKKTGKD